MPDTAVTRGAHHVGLTVPDLDKARAFFVELLGFRQVGEVPDYPAVFVTDGRYRDRAADEFAASGAEVEIVAGLAFGSMALLADGLHMASHAVALAIAYYAYIFARRHARDEREHQLLCFL